MTSHQDGISSVKQNHESKVQNSKERLKDCSNCGSPQLIGDRCSKCMEWVN